MQEITLKNFFEIIKTEEDCINYLIRQKVFYTTMKCSQWVEL
jgi:hypothetical protein